MKILDYINNNKDKYINLFCDMDGVLSEYDINNFDYKTIRPINTSIEFIKNISTYNNINLYILSICKTNKIVEDKITWFNKYMPFLKKENIILLSKEKYNNISSSELKYNYIENHKSDINILIDDDIRILKYIMNNAKDIKVFHVSSIIK